MNAAPAPARQRDPARLASLAVLGAACVFGLNAPFAREASHLGISGAEIVALRVALMIVGVGLFARLTGVSLFVPRGERLRLLAFGICSALVGVSYLSAVGYIPVGVAVMIFYVYPLLILIATPLVDGVRPTPSALVAFAIAFAGIVLGVGANLGALDMRGVALAVMAALAASAQMFLASRAPGGGGVATIFWAQMTILPIAAAFSLAQGGPADWATLKAAAAPTIATMALYGIGYILQIRGLRRVSAARGGLIFCFEPVVATLFAAAWFGERLVAAQYAGVALVVAAVAFSILAPQLRRTAA